MKPTFACSVYAKTEKQWRALAELLHNWDTYGVWAYIWHTIPAFGMTGRRLSLEGRLYTQTGMSLV